jgi:hypothetical protein
MSLAFKLQRFTSNEMKNFTVSDSLSKGFIRK